MRLRAKLAEMGVVHLFVSCRDHYDVNLKAIALDGVISVLQNPHIPMTNEVFSLELVQWMHRMSQYGPSAEVKEKARM